MSFALLFIIWTHLNKIFSTITTMAFHCPIQLVFSFLLSANLFSSAEPQTQARTHSSISTQRLARYFQHHTEKALKNVQSWHQRKSNPALIKPIKKQQVTQNLELGIMEFQCITLSHMVEMLNSTRNRANNSTSLSVSLYVLYIQCTVNLQEFTVSPGSRHTSIICFYTVLFPVVRTVLPE